MCEEGRSGKGNRLEQVPHADTDTRAIWYLNTVAYEGHEATLIHTVKSSTTTGQLGK